MNHTKHPELTKLKISLAHTRTGIKTWQTKYEEGLEQRQAKEAELVKEIARLEALAEQEAELEKETAK